MSDVSGSSRDDIGRIVSWHDRLLVVNLDLGPVIGEKLGPGLLRPNIIPKLDEESVGRLREAGIRDVSALANATTETIGRILDVSGRDAGSILRRAKRLNQESG